MFKNLKIFNPHPETAYKINLCIYGFHILVGIASYLFINLYETPHLKRWSALCLLWTPPYAIEFWFYVLVFILLKRKNRIAKRLIAANMIVILVFILLGSFLGYSMLLSYFVLFWMGIMKLSNTVIYENTYFVIMAFIWLFYLMNTIFWVKHIKEE